MEIAIDPSPAERRPRQFIGNILNTIGNLGIKLGITGEVGIPAVEGLDLRPETFFQIFVENGDYAGLVRVGASMRYIQAAVAVNTGLVQVRLREENGDADYRVPPSERKL